MISGYYWRRPHIPRNFHKFSSRPRQRRTQIRYILRTFEPHRQRTRFGWTFQVSLVCYSRLHFVEIVLQSASEHLVSNDPYSPLHSDDILWAATAFPMRSFRPVDGFLRVDAGLSLRLDLIHALETSSCPVSKSVRANRCAAEKRCR